MSAVDYWLLAVGFLAAGFLVADFLAACLLLSGCLVLWLVAPVSKFQMHTPNSLPLCMSNEEHIIYKSFFLMFNRRVLRIGYCSLLIREEQEIWRISRWT